jgi:glycosyltransferase involved in cell wall biosynthesis
VGKKSKKKKKASNKKHNEQLVNKKVKRPKISLCMIVKNEERYLDNCLKSVKDVVDEIVIVDTGSEDRTVEIAKNYTDKVYFHPWKNSFSEARNHYLKYAAGDWIFQIDADEELVREDVSGVSSETMESFIMRAESITE